MTGKETDSIRAAAGTYRVLHVVPHLGPGGTERQLLSLLRGLHQRGHECTLCVTGSQNVFPERVPPWIQPAFLHYPGSLRDPVGMTRCVRRLRQLIREGNPDIVHSHLWPACRLASAAGRNLRPAHIYHVHDTRPWLSERNLKSRFLRRATRYLWRASGATMVAVSRVARDYTCRHLRIPENCMDVVYNSVDISEFDVRLRKRNTLWPRRIILGMVALLKPEKGHRYAIDAVRKLTDQGVDVELRLAGSGSLTQESVRQARELGVSDRIQFLGLVRDIPRFLGELDILLLPSVSGEGLPLTVLEGMAMALPVIATPIGGTSEAVADGQTGLLVPPRDAVALANAVATLAADPDRRDKFGQQALVAARSRFSLDACVDGVENVYRRILSA